MGDDNEIGVKITGNIDDIMNELGNLVARLGEITDKIVSVVVETDPSSLEEVETASESASNALESVSTSANDASNSVETIDPLPVKETGDAANGAVDGIQALGGAVAALGSITIFDEMAQGAGNYEDTMDRIGVATQVGADNAASAWDGAMEQMGETTGRKASTIREFIVQMGVVGVTSSEVIESAFAGIAGGAYITGKSVETLENAFQRVVLTGVLGRRQLNALGLTTDDLGMSIEDVNAKLATMDSTQRAAFLGQILNTKYAVDGNNAFKVSWQHVTEELQKAYEYLLRIFGGLILPMVIPAVNSLSGGLNTLAKEIEAMDPISKTLLGYLTLFAGTLVTVGGVLAAASGLWNALKISQTLASAATWLNTDAELTNKAIKEQGALTNLRLIASEVSLRTSKIASTLAENAQTAAIGLASGARTVYNASIWGSTAALAKDIIVKGAAIALTVAQTVATGAATVAQYALNLAMSLNPIGIVVIAIAALVAGLYLLYQNNEQVRASVNSLWEQLSGFGAYIQSGFRTSLDSITAPFKEIIKEIKNIGTGLYNAGKEWINNLTRGMEDSMPELQATIQKISDYFPRSPAKIGPLSDLSSESMRNYGNSLVNGFIQGLKQVADFTPLLQPLRSMLWGYDALFSSTAADVENTIKTAATSAADVGVRAAKLMATANTEAAAQAEEAWKTAYDNIKTEAQAALDKLKEIYGQLGYTETAETYSTGDLSAAKGKAYTDLIRQRNALQNKMNEPGTSASDRANYEAQIKEVNAQIKDVLDPTKWKKSGQSVGSSWASGLASGISSGQSTINNAVGNASLALIANSPPVAGPLMNIDKDGLNIGSIFAENIAKGLINTKGIINSGLSRIGLSNVPTMQPSTNQTSTTHITVSLAGANIASNLDATTVGERVGSGLASKIMGQAANAGVSVVNVRR